MLGGKFYFVVKKGRIPGIYLDIMTFNEQINGFKDSVYLVFEDEQKAKRQEASGERRSRRSEQTSYAQPSVEKSTLGDLEELAAIKEKMLGGEDE